MIESSRRAFLGGLGGTALSVSLGTTLFGRTGFALPFAEEDLDFGELEPLAALIQETPPGKLQRVLIAKLKAGLDLRELVAATSLANARTFGGQDYTGYHCMMAMVPAFELSKRLPARLAPLPVLKVVYRTADHIQANGGRANESLHVLEGVGDGPQSLRAAFLARDLDGAERAFAAVCRKDPRAAYDDLQSILQENLDVHRVVLAWRAWETLPITGEQHAETLLRQSVRFCVDAEQERVRRGRPEPELRGLLPALLERHGLATKPQGSRTASDEELDELSLVVFGASKADAAAAVAEALASGMSHADVGEALALAANALLLNDPGRAQAQGNEKPVGSVHGASVGVHASDSARAWRNIAGVSNARNAPASLIAGAYHTAGQSHRVGKQAFPFARHLDGVREASADELLASTRAAITDGDQERAAALVHRYGSLDAPPRPLFDLLLEYAVSEDGALHAEKYYYTVCEEFASARPTFRWRHAVALARVTASEHGWPAPGLAEARAALGV